MAELTYKQMSARGISYDLFQKIQRCENETNELAYTAGIYTKMVRIIPEALCIISQNLNERINRRTKIALDLVNQARILGMNASGVVKYANEAEKSIVKLEKAIDKMIDQQTRYGKHIFDVEIPQDKEVMKAEIIELVRHLCFWSGIEARTIEKETTILEDLKERCISQALRYRRIKNELKRQYGEEEYQRVMDIIAQQEQQEETDIQ